ncbi:claudin-15a isoform X2 [Hemitrygon akajei]|uniref:claudin-15a isoform X2 n=1 Tax=Hemitrygon akajei TaxID=2704970 RepID=UPI003BFA3550
MLPTESFIKVQHHFLTLELGALTTKQSRRKVVAVKSTFLPPSCPKSRPRLVKLTPRRRATNYVRASQALMIISIILGFFAAIVSLFGLQCIQFGTTDPVAKARMATAGGSLYILAALCALVPVSWYAFNITQQFYDPIYPGTKYELGPGLYIGWAGASLQLIGGIILCFACRRTSGRTGEYSYNYRVPRSMAGRVSKNYMSEVDNSSNYGKNAYV